MILSFGSMETFFNKPDSLSMTPLVRTGLPVLDASDPKRIRDLHIGQYTIRYLITYEVIYILRIWYAKIE